MNIQKINPSRILSSILLWVGPIELVQMVQAPDPAHALGHVLTAMSCLLLALHLRFQPGKPVLFMAVALVGICAVIAHAQGPAMGLAMDLAGVKYGLLELTIALLAVVMVEGQARLSEKA